MGNVSFLSPTKNKENFNIEFIYGFLFPKFREHTFDISTEYNSIQVRDNDDVLITDLYFNQECYLFNNIESDVEYLKEIGKKMEVTDYLSFVNSGYDKNNFIQMTYGRGYVFAERSEIEKYLHNYFGLFIFDDGIHPEFMSPDYVWKPKVKKKSFIKKLFNL